MSATPRPLRAKAAQSDGELLARLERIEAKLDALLEQGEKARAARDLPELVAALRGYFGEARFTARSVISVYETDPHSELADVLAETLDMDQPDQACVTALGMLLARMPTLESVGSARGVRVYRLRASRA